MAIEQWDIRRGTGQCAGTGRALEPDEEYFAALVETEKGFERHDFSAQWWQEHRPEVYSFWKTRVPLPAQKKKVFVDDEVLISFFERLEGEEEEHKVSFRFVLALILMRKKLLKYEGAKREQDREVWQMRFVKQEETHVVVNPELEEEQIAQVSEQLREILEGQL